MRSFKPSQSLTPAQRPLRAWLEATARRGVRTYVEVGDALGEIRDRHRNRGTHRRLPSAPDGDPRSEAIARALEQTLRALRAGDLAELDIRLTVGKRRPSAAPVHGSSADPGSVAEAVGKELLPTLRWLLTQSTGTIADAAHRVETQAADLDDHARTRLVEDVRTLDEELATLKALLAGEVDWDSDFEQLLGGEIPPLGEDTVEDE